MYTIIIARARMRICYVWARVIFHEIAHIARRNLIFVDASLSAKTAKIKSLEI